MDVTAVSRDVHGNISRAIWMLSQAEIRYIEATNWTNDIHICDISDNQLRELKRILDDRDIRVSMLETTLGRPGGMERWQRELDIATALETKHVRAMPFEKNTYPYEEVVETLQQATKQAKQHGLIVTVENGGPESHASSPEEIGSLMADVGADNFHLCWDPCTSARSCGHDEKAMAAARKVALEFADYIHVTDIAAKPDQRYVCLGAGTVSYGVILREMVRSGYGGFYALRPRYGNGDMRVLKENCAALRDMLREARRAAATTS